MLNESTLVEVFKVLNIDLSKLNCELDSDEILKLNIAFSNLQKLPSTLNKNLPYHASMDRDTSRIFFTSNYTSTVHALMDEYNSYIRPNIFFSDKVSSGSPFFKVVSNCKRNELLFYQYDGKTTYSFSRKVNGLTAQQIYRFKLIQEKAAALDIIHKELNRRLLCMEKDLPLQNVVYAEKVRQAREVLKNNIHDHYSFPMVSGFATVRNITLQQAAEEIIFNNNCHNYALANIENLRLKYTRIIRSQSSFDGFANIMNEFNKEYNEYANL